MSHSDTTALITEARSWTFIECAASPVGARNMLGRLADALESGQPDLEDVLQVAEGDGIEAAKSHKIRTLMASNRRLREQLVATVEIDTKELRVRDEEITRAREVIEKVRVEVDDFNQSDNEALSEIEHILAAYDQKGSSDG